MPELLFKNNHVEIVEKILNYIMDYSLWTTISSLCVESKNVVRSSSLLWEKVNVQLAYNIIGQDLWQIFPSLFEKANRVVMTDRQLIMSARLNIKKGLWWKGNYPFRLRQHQLHPPYVRINPTQHTFVSPTAIPSGIRLPFTLNWTGTQHLVCFDMGFINIPYVEAVNDVFRGRQAFRGTPATSWSLHCSTNPEAHLSFQGAWRLCSEILPQGLFMSTPSAPCLNVLPLIRTHAGISSLSLKIGWLSNKICLWQSHDLQAELNWPLEHHYRLPLYFFIRFFPSCRANVQIIPEPAFVPSNVTITECQICSHQNMFDVAKNKCSCGRYYCQRHMGTCNQCPWLGCVYCLAEHTCRSSYNESS